MCHHRSRRVKSVGSSECLEAAAVLGDTAIVTISRPTEGHRVNSPHGVVRCWRRSKGRVENSEKELDETRCLAQETIAESRKKVTCGRQLVQEQRLSASLTPVLLDGCCCRLYSDCISSLRRVVLAHWEQVQIASDSEANTHTAKESFHSRTPRSTFLHVPSTFLHQGFISRVLSWYAPCYSQQHLCPPSTASYLNHSCCALDRTASALLHS